MPERKRRDMSHLPRRLLRLEEAAHYCGMSANSFKAHVPVRPRKIGALKLYDLHELDEWISSTRQSASSFDAMLEKL